MKKSHYCNVVIQQGVAWLHKLHDSVSVDQSLLGANMIIYYQWTRYVMYILDVWCLDNESVMNAMYYKYLVMSSDNCQ